MALKYKFDQVLEFPCDQHLRIIVNNSEEQPSLLVEKINEILPNSCTNESVLEQRVSSSGTYTSYTVRVRLDSAESLEKLYAKLVKFSFVKHLL